MNTNSSDDENDIHNGSIHDEGADKEDNQEIGRRKRIILCSNVLPIHLVKGDKGTWSATMNNVGFC